MSTTGDETEAITITITRGPKGYQVHYRNKLAGEATHKLYRLRNHPQTAEATKRQATSELEPIMRACAAWLAGRWNPDGDKRLVHVPPKGAK